jgi:hypothetical protein
MTARRSMFDDLGAIGDRAREIRGGLPTLSVTARCRREARGDRERATEWERGETMPPIGPGHEPICCRSLSGVRTRMTCWGCGAGRRAAALAETESGRPVLGCPRFFPIPGRLMGMRAAAGSGVDIEHDIDGLFVCWNDTEDSMPVRFGPLASLESALRVARVALLILRYPRT